MQYEKLPGPDSDLGRTPLQEAARIVGPSFIYSLAVHPDNLPYARELSARIAAATQENPFAPHINIHTVQSLGPHEWALGANGRWIGSQGVI